MYKCVDMWYNNIEDKGDTMNKDKLKDIFEIILSTKVPSKQLNNYIKETFGEDLTHSELICIGQIIKAQNERDTRAAEFIRDTMGQKPTDKTEISGTKENPFIVTLEGDLAKWSK